MFKKGEGWIFEVSTEMQGGLCATRLQGAMEGFLHSNGISDMSICKHRHVE